jgi:hypothetical protein
MTSAKTLLRRRVAVLSLVLMTVALFSSTAPTQAQSTAQIATNSPLPVFVTNNTMQLPEGFVPGTHWRFTTWTTPSVFTWMTTVNKTSGPWANLTVRNEDGTSSSRWYYVPGMPGSWDRQ